MLKLPLTKRSPIELLLLISSVISVCLTISCQKDEHHVVAILKPAPTLNTLINEFKRSMTEYGYIEGKNITYIDIDHNENMHSDLTNLRQKGIDVILTLTTPLTHAARKALKGSGIPVIFGATYAPVACGLVESLSQQGADITGIKIGGSTPKALEWLLAASPDTKQVFVPVTYDTKAAELNLDELEQAARELNVSLIITEVNSLDELKQSFTSLTDDIDAVFVIASIFIVKNVKHVIDEATQLGVPVGSNIYPSETGITVSYAQDRKRSGRQVSRLVHKVLQGTPAAGLPIETADFFLGLNLKTAKTIGLDIPHEVVRQADIVIR